MFSINVSVQDEYWYAHWENASLNDKIWLWIFNYVIGLLNRLIYKLICLDGPLLFVTMKILVCLDQWFSTFFDPKVSPIVQHNIQKPLILAKNMSSSHRRRVNQLQGKAKSSQFRQEPDMGVM